MCRRSFPFSPNEIGLVLESMYNSRLALNFELPSDNQHSFEAISILLLSTMFP